MTKNPRKDIVAVKPVEPIKAPTSPEVAKFRKVMYDTLTEKIGVPIEEASEIACRYNRLSALGKAIQEGAQLPVNDEMYLKIKKLCLCR
jgi:hypothetical protein